MAESKSFIHCTGHLARYKNPPLTTSTASDNLKYTFIRITMPSGKQNPCLNPAPGSQTQRFCIAAILAAKIIGGAVGGVIVAPLVAPAAAGMLGFSATGPVAGMCFLSHLKGDFSFGIG